jgi:hypothetical protein
MRGIMRETGGKQVENKKKCQLERSVRVPRVV